ncbi:MAG: hypothetical protein H7321_07070, partial [Bacteroidia bacterium]|nr:hypothetical protein [Bacteroidia bacterium]
MSSYSQTVFKYSGVQYTGTGNYTAIRSKVLDSQVYSSPLGIEIDTAGRIYITNEHNIFLLFNGKSKLMAGYNLDPVDGSDYKNGTGIASRFSQPAGIAVNRSTNSMVIVDMGNNLIRSLSPYLNSFTDETAGFIAGTKSFVGGWADGAVATAKFNVPDGVAVNTNGDIYVSDRDGHCIRKISGGNVTTIAGTHGTSGNKDGTGIAATFMNPRGLYLESSTSLLVADYGNQRIRRINLTTNAVTTVISSGLDGPSDLCVVNGQMYITDLLSVKKY